MSKIESPYLVSRTFISNVSRYSVRVLFLCFRSHFRKALLCSMLWDGGARYSAKLSYSRRRELAKTLTQIMMRVSASYRARESDRRVQVHDPKSV